MQTSASVKVINEKLDAFGRYGCVVSSKIDKKGNETVTVRLDGDGELTQFEEADLQALN